MSNLRNGNVPCRYYYNIHVDFKIVYCRMSNLGNGQCHVTNIISHVDRLRLSILRNGHVTLSNLRVKSPLDLLGLAFSRNTLKQTLFNRQNRAWAFVLRHLLEVHSFCGKTTLKLVLPPPSAWLKLAPPPFS